MSDSMSKNDIKMIVIVCFACLLAISPSAVLSSVPTDSLNHIQMVDVTFENRHGTTITGRICWPAMDGKYPAIVISGGWCGCLSQYSNQPEMLARNGYVALLIQPTNQTDAVLSMVYGLTRWTDDLYDAISYLVERSPVNDRVDTQRIGTMGHSLGGITVTREATIDPRVKVVIALSDTDLSALPDLNIPLQIQTGDFDMLVNDNFEAYPSYVAAKPPKQIITIAGATHNGFTELLDAFYPKPEWQRAVFEHYAIAWFDYWLKGDETAYGRLTMGLDGLSPIGVSAYDLGDGEHLMAGGKTFFEAKNVVTCMKMLPDTLKPISRMLSDPIIGAPDILKICPALLAGGSSLISDLVRSLPPAILKLCRY